MRETFGGDGIRVENQGLRATVARAVALPSKPWMDGPKATKRRKWTWRSVS